MEVHGSDPSSCAPAEIHQHHCMYSSQQPRSCDSVNVLFIAHHSCTCSNVHDHDGLHKVIIKVLKSRQATVIFQLIICEEKEGGGEIEDVMLLKRSHTHYTHHPTVEGRAVVDGQFCCPALPCTHCLVCVQSYVPASAACCDDLGTNKDGYILKQFTKSVPQCMFLNSDSIPLAGLCCHGSALPGVEPSSA